MPEGVFLASFAASIKHSVITQKIVDNTTRGAVNEEKERLLTSNWHSPDINDTTIYFIIDKENDLSRDNSVKNTWGMGTLSWELKL